MENPYNKDIESEKFLAYERGREGYSPLPDYTEKEKDAYELGLDDAKEARGGILSRGIDWFRENKDTIIETGLNAKNLYDEINKETPDDGSSTDINVREEEDEKVNWKKVIIISGLSAVGLGFAIWGIKTRKYNALSINKN